jgi:hypothetical protein
MRTYFLRRGFLDGARGLTLAISNAEGSYYRYLKLWLLEQDAQQQNSGNSPLPARPDRR